MSTEQEGSDREFRRIVRLLTRTAKIARDASMTGSLQDGREYVIQQYNAIVAHLSQRGVVLPEYFPSLTPESSFDTVGIACAQLAEYLKEDMDEEEGHWKHKGFGPKGFNINVGDVPELKHLGEMIRESLPEWMREARHGRRGPRPPEPPKPPHAPAASEAPEAEAAAPPSRDLEELESRLADVGARMQHLAERMRRQDMPPWELQRLADELSRLGREHANLIERSTAGGTPEAER